MHAEHGQAGEVDRGGQQPPVLPDPQQPAHAGAPPAVAAAEQVRELAFDLGAVRAVVGPPGGIPLSLAGSSEQRLVGVDADRATGAAAGAPAGERADCAGAAEAGQPAPSRRGMIATVSLAGQVTV